MYQNLEEYFWILLAVLYCPSSPQNTVAAHSKLVCDQDTGNGYLAESNRYCCVLAVVLWVDQLSVLNLLMPVVEVIICAWFNFMFSKSVKYISVKIDLLLN